MNLASIQRGELLGFPSPVTDEEALELVHQRLDADIIQRLFDLGINRAEINALVIPLRTLQHRRTRGERLTMEESDRVLSVLRILSVAEEVYGDMPSALDWLRSANPRLSGWVPMSMLRTSIGNRMVEELLIQIDEGMII